jgi:hypothetical protein
MDKLADLEGFMIEQEPDFGETFGTAPVRHRYRILTLEREPLLVAEERMGSQLATSVFKGYRPFRIDVWDLTKRHVLEVVRPLRVWRDEVRVRDFRGRPIGTVAMNRSVTHHVYEVADRTGTQLSVLRGALVLPARFEILRKNLPFGTIFRAARRASADREADADGFGATFHVEYAATTKALFLAGRFLLDFVHFERRA